MKQHPPINMQFLRRSRKKLEPGDIFVFQLPDKRYVFGRVIRTDMIIVPDAFDPNNKLKGAMTDIILIYIFNAFSKDKYNIPHLDKHNLLIPPKAINRLGWTRGYFETVEHRLLPQEEILTQHCFISKWTWDKRTTILYFDEYGNVLPKKTEPCTTYALSNYHVIDDMVSEALHIPLAPVE